MKNITGIFEEVYVPVKALVIHQSQEHSEHVYVEAYDIGGNGRPFNAHPLTVNETVELAASLNTSAELNNGYLKSKGLLPENVLYINPAAKGYAVWYTPAKESISFLRMA